MRVECTVEQVELENDDGELIASVCATCSRCGHQEESFGTEEKSIKRCLALMRENCEEGESNFYVAED